MFAINFITTLHRHVSVGINHSQICTVHFIKLYAHTYKHTLIIHSSKLSHQMKSHLKTEVAVTNIYKTCLHHNYCSRQPLHPFVFPYLSNISWPFWFQEVRRKVMGTFASLIGNQHRIHLKFLWQLLPINPFTIYCLLPLVNL